MKNGSAILLGGLFVLGVEGVYALAIFVGTHNVSTFVYLIAGATIAMVASLVSIGVATRAYEKQVEEYRALALYDPLTKIPNRRFFEENFNAALRRAMRVGSSLAVMIIDIDDFKAINDTYGHLAGDAVLQETARRLRAGMRESEFIARMGGDEIAGIFEGARTDALPNIGERIVRIATSSPVRIGNGQTVSVAISIGISFLSEEEVKKIGTELMGMPSEQRQEELAAIRTTILARADTLMYKAKRSRGTCVFIGPV